MTGSITHIKNPLTIIGIFASLVELMGLGILPLVEKEIQQIYVWFLMFFPTSLVAAFFVVLYTKHEVLYAPSDYRDDKSFTDLAGKIAPATREKIEEKRIEEVKQIEEAAGRGGANLTIPAATTEARGQVDLVTVSATTLTTSDELVSRNEARLDEAEILKSVRRATVQRAELAERLAIDELEKRYSVTFDRSVNFQGAGTYLFDGLYMGERGIIAVEVKQTKRGLLKADNIEKLFAGPQYLCSVLPSNLQPLLEFVLVFVTEPEAPEDNARIHHSVARILSVSKKYSFKTCVEIIDWTRLNKSSADEIGLLKYARENQD